MHSHGICYLQLDVVTGCGGLLRKISPVDTGLRWTLFFPPPPGIPNSFVAKQDVQSARSLVDDPYTYPLGTSAIVGAQIRPLFVNTPPAVFPLVVPCSHHTSLFYGIGDRKSEGRVTESTGGPTRSLFRPFCVFSNPLRFALSCYHPTSFVFQTSIIPPHIPYFVFLCFVLLD